MVNVSNVKQTELTYTTAVQDGQKSSAPNSIYDVQKSQTTNKTEENKKASKLDELLEKLCVDLTKYNLSPAKLKKSGILYRISGMNEKQVEAADEAKLKQIIECLKSALKDSVVDGKINIEKAGKLGNAYFIAVNTGWTIEGFKKHNNSVKKSSLLQRLKETGCLKNDATLKNTKSGELQKALFDFFNKTLLTPLKNAKSAKEKASIYKGQLQTFGRLLVNTPDEEKAIFKQAIATLAADNRLKGLNAVLASFETPQAKEAWADSWTKDELSQVMSAKDVEGNVPTDKDQTALVANVFGEKSEKSIRETYSQMSEPAKQFFLENADKLKAIKEKEDKGIDLTEEEKELVAQRDLYKNLYSGAMSGTAINTKVALEAKKEILSTMNVDAYTLPIYKEVLKQVNEFLDEHPEALTMPKEELVKLLDETTNGNYSRVAANSEEPLKAPTSESTEATDLINAKSKADYTAAQERKEVLIAEIKANSIKTENKFVVDKSVKETKDAEEDEQKTSDFYALKLQNQAFRDAGYITEYLKKTNESKFGFAAKVFMDFNNMGSTTKDWAMNYFSNASSTVQNLFLNKITGSLSGMIAAAKEVDLSKYNLFGVSVTTQKQIDKIQEEKA